MSNEKPFLEKCGLVARFSPKFTSDLPLLLLAAGGVQHRGQQGAGLVLQGKKKMTRMTKKGLLREAFPPNLIQKINKPSKWTLIHCRYGTDGSYQKINLQPCLINLGESGKAWVIHNGQFINLGEMKKVIGKKLPKGVSDTRIFAEMTAKISGNSAEEKILQAVSFAKGAFSLIIGYKDRLYAARDENGIRPLFIGRLNRKWLIASETHAFDKVGAKNLREIGKGEVIKIDDQGIKVLRLPTKGMGHFCDFEWAYFSRPESIMPVKGGCLSFSFFRTKCGQTLAKEFPIKNADFVVGLPDSGVAVSTGYANALKLPYRQVIIRDHFDPNGSQRLFMRDDQKEKIKSKVLGKLSFVPDKSLWRDAVVVIGDDSIVRGNVSGKITRAVFCLGAREVHWIIGFPPVCHPCHLGVSIRTKEELVAAGFNGEAEKIAKAIGATSVNYISYGGFIKARLLKGKFKFVKNEKEIFLKNGGCGGCLTGIYPKYLY